MTDDLSRKIDYVKFISAIGIVYYHSNIFPAELQKEQMSAMYLYRVLNAFGIIGNTIFIALSAYLFFYNYSEKNARSKRYRRYRSLLIPFFIWNLLGITVYHDFGRSLKHYVTSFLLARYDGVFWVISLLFVMTLFSQINYKIIKNFPLTVIAFCVISILYYVNWNGLFRIFGSFEVRIVRDIYYAAVYELAAATALKYPHAAGKIYSAKQKMVVSFLTAISLFGFWHRIFDMIWIILWPVFVWVSVEKRAGDRKHFISLREQSFFILASHLFVIYYLHKILDLWNYRSFFFYGIECGQNRFWNSDKYNMSAAGNFFAEILCRLFQVDNRQKAGRIWNRKLIL